MNLRLIRCVVHKLINKYNKNLLLNWSFQYFENASITQQSIDKTTLQHFIVVLYGSMLYGRGFLEYSISVVVYILCVGGHSDIHSLSSIQRVIQEPFPSSNLLLWVHHKFVIVMFCCRIFSYWFLRNLLNSFVIWEKLSFKLKLRYIDPVFIEIRFMQWLSRYVLFRYLTFQI